MQVFLFSSKNVMFSHSFKRQGFCISYRSQKYAIIWLYSQMASEFFLQMCKLWNMLVQMEKSLKVEGIFSLREKRVRKLVRFSKGKIIFTVTERCRERVKWMDFSSKLFWEVTALLIIKEKNRWGDFYQKRIMDKDGRVFYVTAVSLVPYWCSYVVVGFVFGS